MTKKIILSLLAILAATPSASYTSDTPWWVKITAGAGATALLVIGYKNFKLQQKNVQLEEKYQGAKRSTEIITRTNQMLSVFTLGMVCKALEQKGKPYYQPQTHHSDNTSQEMREAGAAREEALEIFKKMQSDKKKENDKFEIKKTISDCLSNVVLTGVVTDDLLDTDRFNDAMAQGKSFMATLASNE